MLFDDRLDAASTPSRVVLGTAADGGVSMIIDDAPASGELCRLWAREQWSA
jgi:hypothetical protein